MSIIGTNLREMATNNFKKAIDFSKRVGGDDWQVKTIYIYQDNYNGNLFDESAWRIIKVTIIVTDNSNSPVIRIELCDKQTVITFYKEEMAGITILTNYLRW